MVSGKFHVTLTEIQHQWTLLDLLDAHLVLDALEEIQHVST